MDVLLETTLDSQGAIITHTRAISFFLSSSVLSFFLFLSSFSKRALEAALAL
jgi:hypothetical protein